MTPEQNDFFTILPSCIRYDANISDFAKVLYSEILALSKKNGFCWATNEHFAKAFSKHETTVSRAISELKNQNYIQIETTNSKNGTVRNITPLSENAKRAYSKNAKTPLSDNAKTPLSKNAYHNNTSIKKNKKNNSLKENIFDKRKAKQLPFDVVSSSETIRATFQKPFTELKEDLKNIYQLEPTDSDIETAIISFSKVAISRFDKYQRIREYEKLCNLFKEWITFSLKYEANKPKEQPPNLEAYLLQNYREKDVVHFKEKGDFAKWETVLTENLFKLTNIAKGYKNENLSPLFFFEIMFMPFALHLSGSKPERKLENFEKIYSQQTDYNKEKGDFRKIIKAVYEKTKA